MSNINYDIFDNLEQRLSDMIYQKVQDRLEEQKSQENKSTEQNDEASK